jgi:ABC-2 type transport system ATP-binding protein
MNEGHIVARGTPAALKAQISADVITVHIEGGADELARAEQAARRLEGIEDARIVDGSLVIYVRDGRRAIARIVMLLDEASLQMGEITLAHPTLDDVFLRITGHHIELEQQHAGDAAGSG